MQPLSREKLKMVRKLGSSRKYRLEMRRFICEGIRLVEEGISCDCVDYVVVADRFKGVETDGSANLRNTTTLEGVSCFSVGDKTFKEISQTQNPQGVLAVCRMNENVSIDDIKDETTILMCDDVRDPGNLGTIIRTAESAGIDAIVLSENCVDLYNPKVVRATMGAILRMPICVGADLIEVLARGTWRGIALCGDGELDLYEADLNGNIAIIVGSEAHGVSEMVVEACAAKVRIPMCAGESLNAAVAAGIVMYEWRRGQNGQIRK